eukprot:ANDGO_07755.mRNA.1 hypothetical protein
MCAMQKRRITPTIVSQSVVRSIEQEEAESRPLLSIGIEEICEHVPVLHDHAIEQFRIEVLQRSSYESFPKSCSALLAQYGIRPSTVHYHIKRCNLKLDSSLSDYRLFLMSVLYFWAVNIDSHIHDATDVEMDDLPVYRWNDSQYVLKDDLMHYCSRQYAMEETWYRRCICSILEQEREFVDDLDWSTIEEQVSLLKWKWMTLFHPVGGLVLHPNVAKLDILTVSLARRIMARLHDKECAVMEKHRFVVRDVSANQ